MWELMSLQQWHIYKFEDTKPYFLGMHKYTIFLYTYI